MNTNEDQQLGLVPDFHHPIMGSRTNVPSAPRHYTLLFTLRNTTLPSGGP